MTNNLTLTEQLGHDALIIAPQLLGCVLERQIDRRVLRVKIVEVEAYDQTDIASHAYGGKTKRNQVMYGPAGHLYVYFTYGMHYCCNITTGPDGYGSGCLIRAVEPIDGIDYITERRGKDGFDITNGPAKLCQALGIDMNLSGHDLSKQPLKLIVHPPIDKKLITQTTRIGISKARDVAWRFYITDNPYVSAKTR